MGLLAFLTSDAVVLVPSEGVKPDGARLLYIQVTGIWTVLLGTPSAITGWVWNESVLPPRHRLPGTLVPGASDGGGVDAEHLTGAVEVPLTPLICQSGSLVQPLCTRFVLHPGSAPTGPARPSR